MYLSPIDEIPTFQDFHKRKELKLRVYQSVSLQHIDQLLDVLNSYGWGDEIYKLGLTKDFVDGALGSRTAWQFDAYLDDPDNYGLPIWPNMTVS